MFCLVLGMRRGQRTLLTLAGWVVCSGGCDAAGVNERVCVGELLGGVVRWGT